MGKWTPEEDEKLTEAVTQLGKDWAKVTALVPGRTRGLCRSRWVHYFDPTTNQTSARSGKWTPEARSGKWTPEEDAKLTEAVTELGNDWTAVAAMVPGRVNTQCRSRWALHLYPTIDQGKFLLVERRCKIL
jgi:myb proto-oncogene protein